jgi:hypothetical protein
MSIRDRGGGAPHVFSAEGLAAMFGKVEAGKKGMSEMEKKLDELSALLDEKERSETDREDLPKQIERPVEGEVGTEGVSEAISQLSQMVEALSQEMKEMKTRGTEDVSERIPAVADIRLFEGASFSPDDFTFDRRLDIY